jgi:hypothetical protein
MVKKFFVSVKKILQPMKKFGGVKVRLPKFKISKRRGKYKSKTPESKAKEAQAKTDLYLSTIYLQYLREHPEFAQEIAKQKFGVSFPTEEYEGEGPPDLLEEVKRVQRLKQLLKEDTSESKGGGILGNIANIVQALPSTLQAVAQLQGRGMSQAQTMQIPQPQQTLLPEQQVKSEPQLTADQQALYDFVSELLDKPAEEVAVELHEGRQEKGTLRALLYEALAQGTVDEVMSLEPVLNSMPNYTFLSPLVRRLKTPQGRQWLALLIDQVKKLHSLENQAENEQKSLNPLQNVAENKE